MCEEDFTCRDHARGLWGAPSCPGSHFLYFLYPAQKSHSGQLISQNKEVIQNALVLSWKKKPLKSYVSNRRYRSQHLCIRNNKCVFIYVFSNLTNTENAQSHYSTCKSVSSSIHVQWKDYLGKDDWIEKKQNSTAPPPGVVEGQHLLSQLWHGHDSTLAAAEQTLRWVISIGEERRFVGLYNVTVGDSGAVTVSRVGTAEIYLQDASQI